MENTVTPQVIDEIIANGKTEVKTIGEKTTMVVFTTREGFEIVETSACVDKKNYNEAVGAEICLNRIRDKLWAYEGYLLQKRLASADKEAL